MTGVQFADGFDGPDRIALGLSAPQLATVVGGGLAGYGVLHSPLPGLVAIPAAVLLVLVGAALGWGRLAERPLLDWCWLAMRFATRPRHGGGLLVSEGPEDGEPPWARWLRQGGARRGADAAAEPPVATPPEDGVPSETREWTVEDSASAVVEAPAAVAVPAAAEGGATGDSAAGPPAGGGGRRPSPRDPRSVGLAGALRERWQRRRDARPPGRVAAPDCGPDVAEPPAAEPAESRTLEIDRPSIVLLPQRLDQDEPDDEATTRCDDGGHADELTADAGGDLDAELRATALLRLPHVDEELPATDEPVASASPAARPPLHAGEAPVFVGATRRITFFSLNGGSGRTTLATEVACLLAARGAHRESADSAPRPLSVALLDLDLRSANVSMRIGVPQPTILDYLLDGGEDPATLRRHLVRHPSGLRVLLGPPKPLGQSGPGLEPARVAEIVHQLERDGAHFIVIDVGADLGAVTTWVLTAVHDIYVVIRPTAGGIQDAYRSTEALRRLGLGHKLRYVVNRVRGPLDVDEVMADLGGRIAATIPDDPRIEDAENRHRQVAVDGHGPAATAIARLAADIYPALRPGGRRGRLARLRRRRVG